MFYRVLFVVCCLRAVFKSTCLYVIHVSLFSFLCCLHVNFGLVLFPMLVSDGGLLSTFHYFRLVCCTFVIVLRSGFAFCLVLGFGLRLLSGLIFVYCVS